MKTADRELRNLLEQTQAEVKRLKNQLAVREKPDASVAKLRALEKELQTAHLQIRELETQNAKLQDEHGSQLMALNAELKRAHAETARTLGEEERLRTELKKVSDALARAKEQSKRAKDRPQSSSRSPLDLLRELFARSTKEELEQARKEVARLHQQLSRVQPRRAGRR
ncbi:hypothetical protein JY651_04505 [Pyxidicoccus parkwayensis]|uniref:Uncharacterized protein n=1 Tax=Pyxidicoccus parkwayensis TaxID=2813578 RepID=A0ABX7P0L9_9BACT|nr:hypothetical protein [Pyxidicoccus parkwaysis]QSQ24231.1 hypothetical protein JY651_04505 [Pyxidicoccus parkwaysis]